MKLFFLLSSLILFIQAQNDTFTPYTQASQVPQNVEQLWQDYDARKEALDVEVIQTWKEEGVVCQYIIFTVGTFKGQPARLAAFYTYPQGGSDLPAFVWAHGGGQRAEKTRGYHFAKKGYATLDINWNGREMVKGIEMNTDWGAIDPTQGPKFYPKSKLKKGFHPHPTPTDMTIDTISSPRNSSWFILGVAARRAITFLEQQQEVNPNKIGFTGFSMGGNITSSAAIDKRLKAVVPMVGGSGFFTADVLGYPGSKRTYHDESLYQATIGSESYWPLVTCPVLFLSSSNDFHGRFDRITDCVNLLPHKNWRVTQTIHNDHDPKAKQWLALELWFNYYLKSEGQGLSDLAQSSLQPSSNDNEYHFSVTPANINEVVDVQIYYSYNPHGTLRFNQPVQATQKGNQWSAQLQREENLPLYVFADITYRNNNGKETVYQGETDTYSIISKQHVLTPKKLDISLLDKDSSLRKFEPVFAKFPQNKNEWGPAHKGDLLTYKFQATHLKFPKDKKLVIKFSAQQDKCNFTLIIGSSFHIDRKRNEAKRMTYHASLAANQNHEIMIGLNDFKGKEGEQISCWHNVSTLQIAISNQAKKEKIDLSLDKNKAYLPQISWE